MVEAKNEALEGSSEAAASDPKQEARDLLQAGLSPEEVMEQTGLSKAVVLGLLGAQVKAAKKLSKSGEEPSNSLGKPDDEEKTLISDFKGESSLASSALVLARNKSRLRQTDPALYNSLFPSGQPESNTSRLADLEIARYIKSMRMEEESARHNNGDSTEALNLRKEIDALKEEMHKKDLEALQKQSDKLEAQIGELREDMRHSTNSGSDLAVVVKEASGLLEKVVTSDGVLRRYLLPDKIDIKSASEAPALQGQPEGRNGVLDVLRPYGLVTKIVQRPS